MGAGPSGGSEGVSALMDTRVRGLNQNNRSLEGPRLQGAPLSTDQEYPISGMGVRERSLRRSMISAAVAEGIA